ncbi:MAG: FecR domain-containing protein [Kofleriaceae bacterium]|nr:FecR domain-containing protein [Kofleriaceae bacterium]
MSSCRAIRDWLDRDASMLSDAERLLLEEHLAACDRCARARQQLLKVRDLVVAMPLQALTHQAHQRAIAKAMLQGRAASSRGTSSRIHAWGVCAAGVAAVAALTWWSLGDRSRDEPARRTVEVAVVTDAPRLSPPTAVLSGRVLADGVALTVGGEVPSEVPLHATEPTRIALPATTVMLAGETTIHWRRDAHALLLDTGSVDVELASSAGEPLRVVTEKFTVEVTGTVFQVTPRGVWVSRGSVRVLAPDGAVLAARVAAGEAWTTDAERPAPPRISGRALLARAQRAFTGRDCKAAENDADAALDAGLSRAESAEARTVLAECAQRTGRLEEAARRYEALATRFPDLGAGETALIAWARLEATRARTRHARALFERYLAQYPAGKFADDARRFLKSP